MAYGPAIEINTVKVHSRALSYLPLFLPESMMMVSYLSQKINFFGKSGIVLTVMIVISPV